jgi:hypothetical protein
MQAIESQTLILYHTDLRGQWPHTAAQAFASRLPYARRLALRSASAAAQASLAGIALALRALPQLMRRPVSAGELVFAQGWKPTLATARAFATPARPGAACAAAAAARAEAGPDFSISHSGPWVGCAALAHGRVGFDVEMGTDGRIAQWVLREAALKATGEGLRAVREVHALPVSEGRVRWRGERWQVQRPALFAGACACVVSSLPRHAIEARAVALAELFAP